MAVRVLLLTQWFEPEPTFKGLAFARELQRQGFDVRVLTGFPNYPTGRLYPGFRMSLVRHETMHGVRVTRVPLYPSHDHSVVGRVLNYASFAFSALVAGALLARRIDVIYAYHPPLSVGVTAALLRVLVGKPVVYDVQDMWPDTLAATGMIGNRRLLALIGRVCGWVYRVVDHIVVLSPGFKRLLSERQVPADKVEVIYNWADEVSLRSPEGLVSQAFPTAGRFRILFAGNMGRAQGLDSVLDAAQILQRVKSHVCFVFLGGGVEQARLAERAVALGLDNVVFLPPVSMREVGAYLAAADALLVHLSRDPLFTVTIPSKTQAYLAAGKPILLAVEGDAAALVRESGAGVAVEPERPDALANAAQALSELPAERLAEMGQAARRHYAAHLSIDRGTAAFGSVFSRLAARGGRP